MRYLSRAMAGTVHRAMRTFPVVLLTGARQSGKTTLLRREFGDTHSYVALDRPDLRSRALADPTAFLAENPPPVILDEIQQAPELLPWIKTLVDEDRSPGRWLLSGSQKFQLMKGVSETLAGRIAVLELDTLSVAESLGRAPGSMDELVDRVFHRRTSSKKHVDLADWLLRGGYPEPRLIPDVDRRVWFASYVQTYLERDVRDLLQVGDLATFTRFVSLVASRTGTLLNMTTLGRETGVSGPTVKRWLSVLETSNVVHLLPPYHRNFGKRVRKSHKLYVLDPGLVTFLTGLHSAEAVLHGPSIGALVETAAVSEWIKTARQLGESTGLSYWQSSSGVEVDLVIEHDGRLYGIEIKATSTPNPRHADSLASWLSLATGAHGALACNIPGPLSLDRGIRAVPWHLAW